MNDPHRTKPNPQRLIQDTLYTTKNFLLKTVRTLKSLYQNLPKTSFSNPIFSDNTKISPKKQRLRKIRKKKNAIHTEQTNNLDQDKCSESLIIAMDQSETGDSKQEKSARKVAGGVPAPKPSFRAAEALEEKMKALEMMDIDDEDHALDIEEVFHYYSQLSCPVYLQIVDKFFMDMYTELLFQLPLGRVNSSMRKVGSNSVHSSLRSLGPIKL